MQMRLTSHQTRRTSICALILFAVSLPPVLVRAVQVRDRDSSWAAPSEDAAKPNPFAGRSDVIAGGTKLFRHRCATCHGEDARGTLKGPDLSNPEVQAQTDGALFWKISSGNAHQGMPSFSFLPEAQRWQLVLQLRASASAVR
jgi:mono/diheme cytochrome c family protein